MEFSLSQRNQLDEPCLSLLTEVRLVWKPMWQVLLSVCHTVWLRTQGLYLSPVPIPWPLPLPVTQRKGGCTRPWMLSWQNRPCIKGLLCHSTLMCGFGPYQAWGNTSAITQHPAEQWKTCMSAPAPASAAQLHSRPLRAVLQQACCQWGHCPSKLTSMQAFWKQGRGLEIDQWLTLNDEEFMCNVAISLQELVVFIYFFLHSTRVWTQGLILAKQALYHLRHYQSFLLWLFFRQSLMLWLRSGLRPQSSYLHPSM
jgi:hypothetical protein